MEGDMERDMEGDFGKSLEHQFASLEAKIKSSEAEIKSPNLTLPKDEALVQKLHRKLKEYKNRLKRESDDEDNSFRAPERVFQMTADSRYKVAILEKLLTDGVVDTHNLSRELNKKDGGFSIDDFENACSVIDGYTKGKTYSSGTGLN